MRNGWPNGQSLCNRRALWNICDGPLSLFPLLPVLDSAGRREVDSSVKLATRVANEKKTHKTRSNDLNHRFVFISTTSNHRRDVIVVVVARLS